MPEIEVGKVSDYFARPMVAGVDLIRGLKSGSRIHILGHTTDLEMNVDSIQIDHQDIAEASPGDSVGIKVTDRVRKGDTVYSVMP
jgi:putative protease